MRNDIISRFGEKTIVDGITFDSKSEAEFYKLLKKAKKEKRIKDFEIEPEFILLEEYRDFRNGKVDAIKSYPDFGVTLINCEYVLLDTKGGKHEQLAIDKRKWLMKQNPDIRYYFISHTINALDNKWVDTSVGFNMEKKLRLCYKKEFPSQKGRLTAKSPRFTVKLWHKWMKAECVAGLFFIFEKVYTKKELKSMSK